MVGGDGESFTETLNGALCVSLDPPKVTDLIQYSQRFWILEKGKLFLLTLLYTRFFL